MSTVIQRLDVPVGSNFTNVIIAVVTACTVHALIY